MSELNNSMMFRQWTRYQPFFLSCEHNACYKLHSPSVPLFHHKVAFPSVRCASIGGWFPIHFPTVSLLRKFHVLTFHVPVKAARLRSVGMEAEHCSESIISPIECNATIQNKCNRLSLSQKVSGCRVTQISETLERQRNKANKHVH